MPARKVKKTKSAPVAPLNIRVTPEERAALDDMAYSVKDERGRPSKTSAWARRVLMLATVRPAETSITPDVVSEMTALLVDSCTDIGGNWRDRRDAVLRRVRVATYGAP